MPKELYYSYPSMLLLGDNDEIYIAYSLSPNLIDAYDENGRYLRTLLKREDDIMIPGDNIGNCWQIDYGQVEGDILHFDFFKGLFIKVIQPPLAPRLRRHPPAQSGLRRPSL